MPFPRAPRAPRARRSKKMSSSARSVLSMPEVLEMILLKLPTQDLLINAQRVNSDFRDIIANSPKLQQKLFFRLKPTDSPTKVRINPFLEKFFPTFLSSKLSYGKDLHKFEETADEHITEVYEREEASWRRMLLAQPPLLELQISLCTGYGKSSETKALIWAEDGIKMGLLYDTVENFYCLTNDAVQQWDSHYFIYWYLRPTEVQMCGWSLDYEDYSKLVPVEDKAKDNTANHNNDQQSSGRIELKMVLSRYITAKQQKKFIKNIGYEPVYVEYNVPIALW